MAAIAMTQSSRDTFSSSGGEIVITPIRHASVQVEHAGKVIQVDPWGAEYFSNAKPADLILITDTASDHLDLGALNQIRKPGAPVVIPASAKDKVPGGTVLANGERTTVAGFGVEAVPMYDLIELSPFHPKGIGNGYILSVGGKRVYFAGTTECVPEIQALTNIDVAFLPFNSPNKRMTPVVAAACVKSFKPKVVYPYHYREGKVAEFLAALKDEPVDIRLRNWYPTPPTSEKPVR